GWVSSYTGYPFSKKEMGEYGDNILKKLIPLLNKNMRILEIGCASGITMYRLAPLVKEYYGTDLSGVIIEKNKKRIQKENLDNIKLFCLAAHEISQIDTEQSGTFDLIIINSVIQCFHGHNYLRNVMRKALTMMSEKGMIFAGDLMDQELKKNLEKELKDFRYAHRDADYATKTDWSAELFVHRDFWRNMRRESQEVENVTFSPKIYTIENELTKFRYDALITIDKTKLSKNESSGKTGDYKTAFKYQEDLRALPNDNNLQKKASAAPISSKNHLSAPAYIIYTSGTTGRPKAVLVEHRCVVRLVINTDYIDFKKYRRLLQTGSLSFDASTFEIWGALENGLTLYLVNKDEIISANDLKKIVTRCRIDVMWMTSALFNLHIQEDIGIFEEIKHLLVGGDIVSPVNVKRLRSEYPAIKITNGYGPTENTTFSTTLPVEQDYDKIPIG
ncbi:MAG: AMP-binding protein, partial [bacterium]|nr:AMP-binding protein [bacterium]